MNPYTISGINWLAVLVAAFPYFALGALWYGLLFSKKWIAYQGIDVNDQEFKKGTSGIMTSSFFLMLITCVGLALLISSLENDPTITTGIITGALTGLLFSFTAISISYLYVKKPAALHFIDGLYHVCGQIIAAVILCIWR
ncbi:MAG: DUF1761 domain-containing protein [Chitinophagaceae bacterium]